MERPEFKDSSSESRPAPEGQLERIVELVTAIRELGSHRPPTVQEAVTALEPLADELRVLIGHNIASVINGYSGERPESLQEKRDIAKQLSDLFDGMGLRVKCPKTGKGAAFLATTRGSEDSEGIFCLQVPGRVTRTGFSVALPSLELVLRDMKEKPRGRGSFSS